MMNLIMNMVMNTITKRSANHNELDHGISLFVNIKIIIVS